jgi:hypothetical protein
LETFKLLLAGKHLQRDDVVFPEAVNWLRNFPKSFKMFERDNVRKLVCEAFKMSQEELDVAIIDKQNGKFNGEAPHEEVINASAIRLEQELEEILPKRGMIYDYIEYTRHSEAPLAYHIFCALTVIGAVLNRRVYFNMGMYRVYPTLGVIILGPSGIKKTSAANIAVGILQEVGLVKVYSEKLTPEALIDAMKGDNAVGLVYAPEMTVFLNKQKYNEGLVQVITRFMDCPDVWESGTIGRGKSVIRNVAISSLMCSTLDWFVRATPEDSFGGGFIARNLLIVQNSSARVEPIPDPGDGRLRSRVTDMLSNIHTMSGEIQFSGIARKHYIDWYSTQHLEDVQNPEHELLATYHNRKPDHLKRIAICMHFAEHGDFTLCDRCFDNAIRLLEWTEQFLPELLKQMFKSQVGESHEQVLRLITAHTPLPHSDLVRKMSGKMSAGDLKGIVQSLKEANLVREHADNVGHYYTLMEGE